jgi:hypothetical protein
MAGARLQRARQRAPHSERRAEDEADDQAERRDASLPRARRRTRALKSHTTRRRASTPQPAVWWAMKAQVMRDLCTERDDTTSLGPPCELVLD